MVFADEKANNLGLKRTAVEKLAEILILKNKEI